MRSALLLLLLVAASASASSPSAQDIFRAADAWQQSPLRFVGRSTGAFHIDGTPVKVLAAAPGHGIVGTAHGGQSSVVAVADATGRTLTAIRSINGTLSSSNAALRSTQTQSFRPEVEPVPGFSASRQRAISRCPPSAPTTTSNGTKSLIRVGILHSREVLATDRYRGDSGTAALEVSAAVLEGNAIVFPQSGVDIQIEICANEPAPADFAEHSTPETTLNAFANSVSIAQLRVRNKCDIMVLLASPAGLGNVACGIGYLPGTSTVVAADCFLDNLSFLHEFGHNIGACHGAPARLCGAGANAYGDATHGFRTIMAYQEICPRWSYCTRIPRFSNKKSTFSWQSYPIGNDNSDNAWVLNAHRESAASSVC